MIKKLKDYIKEPPIEIEGFIELSIPLTELVLREHQENGMIGCLSPVNISIQWDEKTARMIKIGVGNAAYRSPEQSGRINRVPDERSDLYAVGVIFMSCSPDNCLFFLKTVKIGVLYILAGSLSFIIGWREKGRCKIF